MDDTVYIEFSNKMGDVLSQKPFVVWDEKLFRCIFENYEYTQSIKKGNEWIYRDPITCSDFYKAKHREEFEKVAQIVSVVNTGMVIRPVSWYREEIISSNFKLKNLFLYNTSYSDNEEADAAIIYGGTWLVPGILSKPSDMEKYCAGNTGIIFVDESIIKRNKNTIDTKGKDIFNINEYRYITSLSKHIFTGLTNSQFPLNLISKMTSSTNEQMIVFPSNFIGDKKFDDFINLINRRKVVYLDKNKKYSILEKVYCIHSFDEVTLI